MSDPAGAARLHRHDRPGLQELVNLPREIESSCAASTGVYARRLLAGTGHSRRARWGPPVAGSKHSACLCQSRRSGRPLRCGQQHRPCRGRRMTPVELGTYERVTVQCECATRLDVILVRTDRWGLTLNNWKRAEGQRRHLTLTEVSGPAVNYNCRCRRTHSLNRKRLWRTSRDRLAAGAASSSQASTSRHATRRAGSRCVRRPTPGPWSPA